jgi:putative PIN family toxin of toxin-antitoxin system
LNIVTRETVLLFISVQTLDELRDVTSRPHLIRKYHLDPTVVAKFIKDLEMVATCLDDVPHVFDFQRDPDDAHYIDLAVAANARLIVSRDKDLLSLRDTTTQDGQEFTARFPFLSILTPTEALHLFATNRLGADD